MTPDPQGYTGQGTAGSLAQGYSVNLLMVTLPFSFPDMILYLLAHLPRPFPSPLY
jgi:hypothetical protein